ELRRLRAAVATTARRVAPGRTPRDRNKVAYDRHGERVQSQVSRRVRDARRRLEELAREQVPRPPAPLRLRAPLTRAGRRGDRSTAATAVAVTVRDVTVPGR